MKSNKTDKINELARKFKEYNNTPTETAIRGYNKTANVSELKEKLNNVIQNNVNSIVNNSTVNTNIKNVSNTEMINTSFIIVDDDVLYSWNKKKHQITFYFSETVTTQIRTIAEFIERMSKTSNVVLVNVSETNNIWEMTFEYQYLLNF